MKLLNGITYAHEHITIDLSGPKKDEDCKLDTMEEIIKELKELKSKGVSNIIDVTNRGMGRNIEFLTKVKDETGINILSSTGYYKSPFFPEEVYKLSIKELAHIMLMEITDGIDNTGVKADIIGEIGTSKDNILPEEEKVFRAASMVHVETGKPIVTHTTLGTLGLEQLKIFKEYGVNLDKVVISHVDLSGDLDCILRLIDSGANVAFDTIGKINYQPEAVRVNLLKELSKRGLSEKIVLSMDITRKSHLKYLNGLGYSYLLDNFVPLLRKGGISEAQIDNMIKNNALRIYA
ncbi:phosphotriesterase [Clostridium sp. CF012]|uniref:phosphotriesterase family protein n=1 Tax=Clostridium sp. CF012 TaxID=2843319 RepID=UPI001C0BA66C|nr:phosphotriesterase-related protein [Clostridium sp. CF012]MBU3145817.1 phosphotriesterase-related protein [Clostridium sp. CF012]